MYAYGISIHMYHIISIVACNILTEIKDDMKLNQLSDKYAAAWEKLAEYVVNGNKGHALGIYRLLSHSLKDKALMHQLEGDILLSFNDIPAAIEPYKQAAQTYQQDNRLLEAALVFDHLSLIQPNVDEHISNARELYKRLALDQANTQRLQTNVTRS